MREGFCFIQEWYRRGANFDILTRFDRLYGIKKCFCENEYAELLLEIDTLESNRS